MLITKLYIAMGKVGRRNFGEFMVIRQIRQRFPPPKFPSIQYMVFTIIYVEYQAMIGNFCSQKVYIYFTYDTVQVCSYKIFFAYK